MANSVEEALATRTTIGCAYIFTALALAIALAWMLRSGISCVGGPEMASPILVATILTLPATFAASGLVLVRGGYGLSINQKMALGPLVHIAAAYGIWRIEAAAHPASLPSITIDLT